MGNGRITEHNMKIGIGTYTYTWAIGVPGHPPQQPLDAFGLLAKAQQLGVQVVQFCENLPLTGLSETELAALIGHAHSRGISLEIGTRGLNPENLRAHLRLAVRLGCGFVRLVIDSAGDEPSAEEAVRRLAPLMPEWAAAGVRLGIENHDRFSAAVLAEMVRQLGEDRAGIVLDTVNSFGALEPPATVVKILAPYVVSLHVKDFVVRRMDHRMGLVIEGRPAGAGRLDIPGTLDELRAAGRDFNAIVELWPPPAARLEQTLDCESDWAESSVRYLRTLITG